MPKILDQIGLVTINTDAIFDRTAKLIDACKKHKETTLHLEQKNNNFLRALAEIDRLKKIAQDESVKYNLYKDKIMPAAIEARRRGDTIDNASLTKLNELDIDQNIAAENLDEANSRIKIIQEEKDSLQSESHKSIANSLEIIKFDFTYTIAKDNFLSLTLLLQSLGIDIFDSEFHKQFIDQGHSNTLKRYLDLMESGALIEIAKSCTNDNFNLTDLPGILENLNIISSIDSIDSSTLFSEICIFLSFNIQSKFSCFPEQHQTLENLTPF